MTGSAGLVFHVMNRGVRRLRLFERPDEYRAFIDVFAEAQTKRPIRCLSYCLMPNHFHFVLWPQSDGGLSAFMHWMTITHSKRWHVWRNTTGTGHVYQGRFKALPVSSDTHFLRLCRYVERNPVRAGLVTQAAQWPWSSLAQRGGHDLPVVLSDWPVDRPANWLDLLAADEPAETDEIRRCMKLRVPLGSDDWRGGVARLLDLRLGPARPGPKPR